VLEIENNKGKERDLDLVPANAMNNTKNAVPALTKKTLIKMA